MFAWLFKLAPDSHNALAYAIAEIKKGARQRVPTFYKIGSSTWARASDKRINSSTNRRIIDYKVEAF